MTEPLASALAELDRLSSEATERVDALTTQLEEARDDLARVTQARAALVALLNASTRDDVADGKEVRGTESSPTTSTSSGPGQDEMTSPPPSDRPRTVEAARMLLLESAERDVDLASIRNEFRSRGWLDPEAKAPDALVYAGLRRLEREDVHVVRTGKRTWRYSADPDRVPHYRIPADASAGAKPPVAPALPADAAEAETSTSPITEQVT